MDNLSADNFRKNLSAISLIAAPLLLLIGDLVGLEPRLYYVHYFLCKAALAMFIFAVFALVELLRPFADRIGLIGGGMAIIGAISGATLFSFVYFYNEMANAGIEKTVDAVTVETLGQIFQRVYMTMVLAPLPGLFFPIGLLILSICFFASKLVPRPIAVALGLGAILFPAGRIPGILSVSIVSDVFLAASMCFIGWRLLVRSETSRRNDVLVVAATGH